jgi:hypothetical protein
MTRTLSAQSASSDEWSGEDDVDDDLDVQLSPGSGPLAAVKHP